MMKFPLLLQTKELWWLGLSVYSFVNQAWNSLVDMDEIASLDRLGSKRMQQAKSFLFVMKWSILNLFDAGPVAQSPLLLPKSSKD